MFSLLRRKAKAREIFHYHDGVRERAADPVVIFRLMAAHEEFVLEKHVEQLSCGIAKLENEAAEVAVKATRDIFGIPAWSESQEGLTEVETIEVLNAFIEYVHGLKKNGNGQPT